MKLILVRHGQTSSNVGGLLDTAEPGAGLTPLGREQAAALPEALVGEHVEALFASTLVRTQQTARPLAATANVEIQVRPGVREIRAGDLEMLGDEASVRAYLGTIFEWASGNPDARIPGGESGTEFFARYDQVIADVAGSGVTTAVVVSHGAAIRAWSAGRTDNVTVEHAAYNPISNTGAVVLEGSLRDGWTVLTWEGHALGGAAVDAPTAAGPTGEPAHITR